jgi:hypothetical protein
MPNKDAALTVRIPLGLKRRLEAVARRERRSLSAQIIAMLEKEAQKEPVAAAPRGRLLGRFEGTCLPSDQDLSEMRRLLRGAGGFRSGRAT